MKKQAPLKCSLVSNKMKLLASVIDLTHRIERCSLFPGAGLSWALIIPSESPETSVVSAAPREGKPRLLS